MNVPGLEDEDDTAYPTSARTVQMMRALALGLALLLLLLLVFALTL